MEIERITKLDYTRSPRQVFLKPRFYMEKSWIGGPGGPTGQNMEGGGNDLEVVVGGGIYTEFTAYDPKDPTKERLEKQLLGGSKVTVKGLRAASVLENKLASNHCILYTSSESDEVKV